MFKQDPLFIVAAEIIKTSRIFASSVSPLTKKVLDIINPSLYDKLLECKKLKDEEEIIKIKTTETHQTKTEKSEKSETKDGLSLGGFVFKTKSVKGKKTAILPIQDFLQAIATEKNENKLNNAAQIKCKIVTTDNGVLLENEKLSLAITLAQTLDLSPISEKKWNRKMNVNIYDEKGRETLIKSLDCILRVAIAKQKNREYGFICLFNDGNGNYWFKVSRGFSTALVESHSSIETLIEEQINFSDEEKTKINKILSILNNSYY
jgi:hypothetical protein